MPVFSEKITLSQEILENLPVKIFFTKGATILNLLKVRSLNTHGFSYGERGRTAEKYFGIFSHCPVFKHGGVSLNFSRNSLGTLREESHLLTGYEY